MKVILDEDLPHKLRLHLTEYEVFTVAYMGWGGLKNGELLGEAERAGFDVLLTGDQSMPHEQNVSARKLAAVTLSAVEGPIIKHHIAEIAAALNSAKAGTVVRVDCGAFLRRRVKPQMPPLG